MKKLSKIVLSLFLLLGIIGCSDGIKDSNLEIPKLKPQVNGIDIPFERNPTGVAGPINSIFINRKLKGAASWSDYSMSVWLNNIEPNQNFIKDYFVEAGKEYEYQITYNNNQSAPTTVTKKATDGLGELKFPSDASAKYDETTGIMKLSDMNNIIKDIYVEPNEYNRTDKRVSVNLSYQTSDNNNVSGCGSEFISFSPSVEDPKYFGKELNLSSVNLEANINNVSYNAYFDTPTEVSFIPNTIKIPDTRFNVNCYSDYDGIHLSFPMDGNAKQIRINRKINDPSQTPNYNGYDNWMWISTENLTNKEKYITVTDYFLPVDPNLTYSYKVEYYDVSNTVFKNSKETTPVTYNADYGELTRESVLTSFENLKNENGVLIFKDNELPNYVKVLKKNWCLRNNIEMRLRNENGYSFNCSIDQDGKFYLKNAIANSGNSDRFYNKPLYVDWIRVNVNVNGVRYNYYEYSRDEIRSNCTDLKEIEIKK